MKRQRSHRLNPVKRLALEMRVAASRINDAQSRAIAAREADLIPVTLIEQRGSKRGELARLAREKMRALPTMDEADRIDAATFLRGAAEAIDSDFRITDETWLGQRRRHQTAAA